MHGDSAWLLMAGISREDAVFYLDDRQARRFNTLLINLIDRGAPQNFYGNAPFTTANDFATPNEAYFAHCEYVLAQARQRGFLVLLAPAYLGFNGGSEGFYQAMQANGATKMRDYGRYVATRFAAYDNVLWVNGGDFNPPDKTLTRAVALGINDILPNALQTVHCVRLTGGLDYWRGESWLDVNTAYTQSDVVTPCQVQYQQPEQMPFFLIEAYYENMNGSTRDSLRRQAWGSVLAGAFGQLFGNAPIWDFNLVTTGVPNWKTFLNSGGAQDMTRLWDLVSTLRWDLFVPDLFNTFVTSGAQTGVNQTGASVASDSSFAMVYVPNARTMTLNLARLSGPNVRARWYDPSNGAFTTVSGSPFAPTSRNFTTPGANAGGQGDWVLLLESV